MSWGLFLETTTRVGSVALFQDDHVVASSHWSGDRSHSEEIHPGISKICQEANVSIQDIDRVLVNIGPGSFTGLRVAVNVAKTLAYSTSAELLKFSSMQALRASHSIEEPCLTFLFAFRNLYYCQWHGQAPEEAGPIEVLTDSELIHKYKESAHFIGLRSGPITESLGHHVAEGRIHWVNLQCDNYGHRIVAESTQWNQLEPLYVRASEPEIKLQQGAIRAFQPKRQH